MMQYNEQIAKACNDEDVEESLEIIENVKFIKFLH